MKPLLDSLLRDKAHIKINVCLLDPFGNVWRSKIASRQHTQAKFLDDATDVFRNLSTLAANHGNKLKVCLYDDEPISCVVAGGAIYLAPYLPRTERRESPELTISLGSFLGDKVYEESVKKLLATSLEVSHETLTSYVAIMEKHIPDKDSDENFWGDPAVHCEFCKESAGHFSAFTRRHPTFGTRVAVKTKHFQIVPSLGQLAADHALIISHAHLTSSAQLDSTARSELETVMKLAQASAAPKNMTQFFFEHGLPYEGSGFGGCGICHCHVHSIPLQNGISVSADELEAFIKFRNIDCERHNLDSWSEVHKWAKQSYLCVKSGEGKPVVFVFALGQRLESQLMRQFIAEKRPTANKNWDWRCMEDSPDNLKQTIAHLKSALNEVAV